MKQIRILLVTAGLLIFSLPALASRLGDIRLHARFLTDRMAYELRLSPQQYNDVFEINFDFLTAVDPLTDDMARGYRYAYDRYYRYLDMRNDDLRWVLAGSIYTRLMRIDYFFRPLCIIDHSCHLRVYRVYTDHSHFHFRRSAHYFTYHGAHCRSHYGGASYYRKHYKEHYRHNPYTGSVSCRPEHKRQDYIIGGKPAALHHPPHSNRRPTHPAVRPQQPSRPVNKRPSTEDFRRPDSRPERKPKAERRKPAKNNRQNNAGGGRKAVKENQRRTQAVREL